MCAYQLITNGQNFTEISLACVNILQKALVGDFFDSHCRVFDRAVYRVCEHFSVTVNAVILKFQQKIMQ